MRNKSNNRRMIFNYFVVIYYEKLRRVRLSKISFNKELNVVPYSYFRTRGCYCYACYAYLYLHTYRSLYGDIVYVRLFVDMPIFLIVGTISEYPN
uniref:Uncharacterized protein n=1 Tax=Parascaris univalens TaxID=6257 RepID=A0A914ZP13_PARUN